MSSEWRALRLMDIALPGKDGLVDGPFGSNLPSSTYTQFGVPVIRGSNLTKGSERFKSDEFVYVSSDTAARLSRSLCLPKDIVFTKKGTLGQIGLVPFGTHSTYLLSSNQMRLRVDESCADPEFVYYYLAQPESIEKIIRDSEHTGVPKINLGYLKSFPILLPEVRTQKVIASALSAFDERITLLRETNATLEAIAQALFKSWFVDFDPVRAKMAGRAPEGMDEATAALFPDALEETELGLVPKGWRVMPFLEACDLQGGAQPPASTFVDTPRDGYVRLLQIRDFSTDAHKTYIPDTTKLKKATEDDVLLGRYGSASGDKAKDSLGRVCRGLSGAYNVALMKLVPIHVGREFALQLVNDPRFYNYLQGVSSKAVQSGFSKSELGQYKVVVPPQELSDVFEDIGLTFWERLKHGVARQREMAELRDTLLPRLISGQLRLPEAQAQLEDALT